MPLPGLVVGDGVDALGRHPEIEREVDRAVADGVEHDGGPFGSGGADGIREPFSV